MTPAPPTTLSRPPNWPRAMITRYGMTDEFDMMALETVQNQYLGGDASLTCGAQTAARIDEMSPRPSARPTKRPTTC